MNKDNEKVRVFIWSLFDFANTSYSIVVVTFLYAVYFKQTVLSRQPIGDFYWSIGTSVSMFITALISPILGAIADYSAGKKRFLLVFTLACIISTSLLYFVNKGDVFLGLLLFIIANVGFEAGLVFYDSFLPELTAPKNYGRVSGYGFAMGYLGSLTTLAIVYPFITNNLIKESFPISALVFLIFSLPLFLFLKENKNNIEKKESFLRIGFFRVFNTVTNLKKYKNLTLFLISFFFYIEGVNTVIFFSGNYATTTLNFSLGQLIVFFLIVQSTAILGSLLFGFIADSFGQKKSLISSLIIWIFTILIAFVTSDKNSSVVIRVSNYFNITIEQFGNYSFYFVGLLAGSVMGATQSTSRSLMSKLTPFDKKTEFFGFYSFFGKSSAILGPLVFGYVSFISGDQRLAILTINIFFFIGLFILTYVKDN
ncbi:MFS transporter [Stygiobacter electus]|uniref:MFS transporter n=1 Tax=Stygiobacter electus TaxID=3032292 RepID=A0AAE3NXF6_9BACT|nr:MFS transporter [Stygiobacter electus]MDF1610559.1 MFS transporter [Stygiobacter electus]